MMCCLSLQWGTAIFDWRRKAEAMGPSEVELFPETPARPFGEQPWSTMLHCLKQAEAKGPSEVKVFHGSFVNSFGELPVQDVILFDSS